MTVDSNYNLAVYLKSLDKLCTYYNLTVDNYADCNFPVYKATVI